ncbi:unknown [Neodiprion lecontei nucleopolyhedrovirus]|uniref:Uncharacterized protein n=1 Tax=Neodiprion lecontei nucleopolyhedrovirus (strain Canada) TaxID=654906 RepID=Q6JP81_NPVNC|nr:unknown [Neodiprion lecontei nucleopolyhedrovirus]AAQ99121.1 unknown [Neodiprion lecontei nucleopolyhedrovirus]
MNVTRHNIYYYFIILLLYNFCSFLSDVQSCYINKILLLKILWHIFYLILIVFLKIIRIGFIIVDETNTFVVQFLLIFIRCTIMLYK